MIPDWLSEAWPYFLLLLQLVVAALAAGHALINKREVRSTIGWVGLIWLTPYVGALLYLMFGINRIARKAHLRRGSAQQVEAVLPEHVQPLIGEPPPEFPERWRALANIVDKLSARQLTSGNKVEVLVNGDEAFPAMLQAIEEAQSSIALCTYIFDNDRSGREFIDALAGAVRRGVEVKVLVDAVGARYSWPSITGLLTKEGIPAATFMPTIGFTYFVYSNLRNHRKIMVVDGHLGFAGGINIREGNVLKQPSKHPIQDLHFRLQGPVVSQLQEVVASDWLFATHERLEGDLWFPELQPRGDMWARGISDGPDEDFDKLRMTFAGAINAAQRRVLLITPYFLPDEALSSALNLAALRGLEVDIGLPAKNNLKLVQWASTAMLWQVLEDGCRVWLTPPPFDHSKMLVIDDEYVLIGSANLDPRSLRLNFEFNVECYSQQLAGRLTEIAEAKLNAARRVTLDDVDGRSLPVKLRDGAARLLSPYL